MPSWPKRLYAAVCASLARSVVRLLLRLPDRGVARLVRAVATLMRWSGAPGWTCDDLDTAAEVFATDPALAARCREGIAQGRRQFWFLLRGLFLYGVPV